MTGNNNPKKQCIIHGHFYQPPRENPWLDAIENQPSAAPHHDWNERIYDECYRPNAFSRLLDKNGMIEDVHNNYYDLSFNFGPTLFRWLEANHPLTASRIIEADKRSVKRFGHGNSVAQVYNHMIMPLASKRDQLTQIRWAKSFFRKRFGRETEGIWLAETAINMETVKSLIEENIKFVILSPTQAEAVTKLDDPEALWDSVANGSINTKRAYRIYNRDDAGNSLGGHIDAFFFDEGLSRAVSFEKLLTDSKKFGDRINSAYSKKQSEDEAVIIATDGETFGHHSAYGDMCLAHFFTKRVDDYNIEPVNFGTFLEQHPPKFEVKIKNGFSEGSAWSCAHGTGRWIRDCGCQTGGYDHWNQKWRTPLREALNYLQSVLDEEYENFANKFCDDPWRLRDRYEVAINDKMYNPEAFILDETSLTKDDSENIELLAKMLEAQKFILFSFTSCGWFFADISGIEPVQNMQFAARALQLGLTGKLRSETKSTFLSILSRAKSNIPNTNGRTLFEKYAEPLMHHRETLCFTAAAERTLFESSKNIFNYFNFKVELQKENDRNIAVLSNSETGENDKYSVELFGEGGNLSGVVTKITDSEHQPDPITIKLSGIFTEMKNDFTTKLFTQMSSAGAVKLSSWCNDCETTLEKLTELNGVLPEKVHGPVSFILTSEWDSIIQDVKDVESGASTREKLKAVYDRALYFGVELNLNGTATLLEKLIKGEIERFLELQEKFSFSRVAYLLDIADSFGVPLTKSSLEDRFYGAFAIVLKKTDGKLPKEILDFAARMNFVIKNSK